MLGDGCFSHVNTTPQRIVNLMLDGLGIAYENEHKFFNYSIDNYLCDKRLCVEVMGDYWHCSPMKYKNIAHKAQYKAVSRDIAKRLVINELSFMNGNVLYLWEWDILNRPILCSKLLKTFYMNSGLLADYNSFNYHVDNNELKYRFVAMPYQEMSQEDVNRLYAEAV